MKDVTSANGEGFVLADCRSFKCDGNWSVSILNVCLFVLIFG